MEDDDSEELDFEPRGLLREAGSRSISEQHSEEHENLSESEEDMNRSEDDMNDPDLFGSEHGQENDEEEQNSDDEEEEQNSEEYGGEEDEHLSDPEDVRPHTLVAEGRIHQ